MEKNLANQILSKIEAFSDPINTLGELLGKIENEQQRRVLRKNLGELMAILEYDIRHQVQKELEKE